ncbi:hypothetical protein ACIRSU_31970 [Streptomyces sp. NPDC101160]|uniref:hypothetical protein n=1 Tax=Streptomyces sp. NPDC101160 TaxID=3366118 RepID=UPI0038225AE0
MPVVVTVEIPGISREVYESINQQITNASWWPAEGFIAHSAGPGDGGWRVIDFWESEAAFRAFMEKAAPIFQSVGAPQITPKFHEAANVIVGG